MNIQELFLKIKTEKLTHEEQQFLLSSLMEEMATFKKSDPEKYLQFLEELNATIAELNSSLKVLSPA